MKLHRTCMRDPIRDTLASRILDGVYPEGTHLKELALAREFNVSQAPVREALRELETLGLVETERYRGTRVRSVDLEELREAYALRKLLETAAVRATQSFNKDDLDELDQLVNLLEHKQGHETPPPPPPASAPAAAPASTATPATGPATPPATSSGS